MAPQRLSILGSYCSNRGFPRGFTRSCFSQAGGEMSAYLSSFVKTFKRDYVYVHDSPDAKTVLSQLSAWFEDYNESHPHKALQMKSPRELMRSYQPAACPV